MSSNRVMILDDKGVLWSSDSAEARLEGLGILHAVEQGRKHEYCDAIGESWTGDLVLVEELARVR